MSGSTAGITHVPRSVSFSGIQATYEFQGRAVVRSGHCPHDPSGQRVAARERLIALGADARRFMGGPAIAPGRHRRSIAETVSYMPSGCSAQRERVRA